MPTVADLRARRLELTRGSLEEALLEGEDSLETYRVVVNALAAEYDVVDIAAAAVKLADERGRDGDGAEEEIPDVPGPWSGRAWRVSVVGRVATRVAGGASATVRGERECREDRDPRADRGSRRGGRGRQADLDVTRVYVGCGAKGGRSSWRSRRRDRERSERGLEQHRRDRDRGSVLAGRGAGAMAERIIDALRSTTIKGKRVTVRRDRDFEAGGRD